LELLSGRIERKRKDLGQTELGWAGLTLMSRRLSADSPDQLLISNTDVVDDTLSEETFKGDESVHSIENVAAGDCRMRRSCS
jgi:hypothetical protein